MKDKDVDLKTLHPIQDIRVLQYRKRGSDIDGNPVMVDTAYVLQIRRQGHDWEPVPVEIIDLEEPLKD